MRKLDVVMSVYNGEQYLSAAIESILRQTYRNFRFIIVNNGSTDNTAKILQHYADLDPRITVLSNSKTLSYVEGRMIAIAHSDSEWFANMDADDISLPQRLEKQLAFINQHTEQLGCVGSWAKYLNANGQIIGNRKTRPSTVAQLQTMLNNQEAILVTDPSAIINKKIFLEVGGYRSECVPAADLDLFYRIAESGKWVISVPEYLLHYRVHSGADSVKKFMFQRLKTHYINYNMRKRRLGSKEITYQDFINKIWKKWHYKLPRLYKDYAKSFYKKAGMLYLDKKYLRMSILLLIATVIWPKYVIQRLFAHKLNKGFI